jgi:hypothetical protein
VAIDLRPARRAVDKQFFQPGKSDQCTISRDSENVYDDVLDPVTLQLSPPASDEAPVYAGPCLVGAVQRSEAERGGQYLQANRYSVKVPYSAPVVVVGDLIEITSSVFDPQLVGAVFVVREIVKTSLLVWRKFICEDITVVPL